MGASLEFMTICSMQISLSVSEAINRMSSMNTTSVSVTQTPAEGGCLPPLFGSLALYPGWYRTGLGQPLCLG
eukprot:8441941-Prorocentrum_lima.AAC.1